MTHEHKTLGRVAKDAGFDPFSFDGSYQGTLPQAAERALEGKTHYFNAGTRRYFGARVHMLRSAFEGLALYAVESVAPPSGPRLFRFVCFDCTGWTLYRTEHKTNDFDGFTNRKDAEIDGKAWLDQQSGRAILSTMIERADKDARRTLERLTAAREALDEPVSA